MTSHHFKLPIVKGVITPTHNARTTHAANAAIRCTILFRFNLISLFLRTQSFFLQMRPQSSFHQSDRLHSIIFLFPYIRSPPSERRRTQGNEKDFRRTLCYNVYLLSLIAVVFFTFIEALADRLRIRFISTLLYP